MTTVVKNTNISDLLEVSRGNFAVLKRMTNEFRDLVESPNKGERKSGDETPKEKPGK
jgi:hypothetical protein